MEANFEKDDYFKIDVEAHIIGDMKHIEYFPGVQAWWKGVAGATRMLLLNIPEEYALEPEDLVKRDTPEDLIELMDSFGVDMACLLPEPMMDTTGYATRWTTNGALIEARDKFPDRFILVPNVGPIIKRGLANAIWELEYLVKEHDAKMVKFYPPEDAPINDSRLWPFYEKVSELGIPISIHTGWSWCPPGKSAYCLPVLLDEVASDFPDMKIVAFHMGWPYPHDLNMVGMTHPNVYLSLSVLVPWALTAPARFAELLGEAMRFVGSDRIIWGVDFAGFPLQIKAAVEGLRVFQLPEETCRLYGYPPLTDEDKAKIFGLNLAGLLGIEPRRRV
jgi:predicted TIM-barrel fold metal-dependent hydrolase